MTMMIEILLENPLLLLVMTAGIGYLIGRIKLGGGSLGVAAVLFVGLAFGALHPDMRLPEIIYLLGLVFFVYTIGLSSGPGFFASFRGTGLRDNMLVVAMIAVVALLLVLAHSALGLSAPTTAGLFAGSLTNTPALAGIIEYLKGTAGSGQEQLLAEHGLARGKDGLRHIMMCEVPSNAILAPQFLAYFDGFSIGSNDLTQLTLGLDRDSGLELLAADFDERDPAVKAMLKLAIKACKDSGKYVGICGQGPSDHPDFARWLAEEGIVSISLNPDTVIETWKALAA